MAGNSSVALGFRFYPTEEELVGFYLRNKLEDKRKDMERVIPVLDVYSYEPSQLPQMSGEPCVWDLEQWFFFCPMQLSEAQGGRPTRTTSSGYWKATGSPAFVYSTTTGKAVAIGVKKTMVFYEGRAPRGTKTKWKMNEYRAFRFDSATSSPTTQPSPRLCNQFSLCRVYVKSGCPRAFDRRPSTSTSVAASTSRSHETTVAATGHNGSLGRSADAERSSSGHRGWGEDDYDWSLIQNMDWDF